MRNKVAQSHRIRQYETFPNGAIRNVGLRRAYREAKREYKRERRRGEYPA